MDAAGHRIAEAEGREPVSAGTDLDCEFTTSERKDPSASRGVRQVSAAEGYERWASIYDDVPNPLLAREERYLLPLLMEMRKSSVLDLACGTGRWMEKVVQFGCTSAVGVDCSGAMLSIAAGKQKVRGRLARAACENLPLPDATFALVICSFALGHVQDVKGMVLELARVTTADAHVFVSDLHAEAYARGWRVGFRDRGSAIEIRMRARSAEEIVGEFCASGFECLTQESLWLGDPESPLFARAGKADFFPDACRVPAILACHFRKAAQAGGKSA
jgi:ubiquinone/menaquinone biosynthesis C-methylase UbiE